MLENALVFVDGRGGSNSVLPSLVRSCGLHSFVAHSTADLLCLWKQHSPECLVILANSSPEESLKVATEIRKADEHCALLLIAPNISIDLALRALRVGVSDVLNGSDVPPAQALQAITALLERHHNCRHCSESPAIRSDLIGGSAAMSRARNLIMKAALADANVLITGESGTGKELAAQTIHHHSPRRMQPFVAVNCAALPDGLLESELFGYERGAFTGAHTRHVGKLQHAAGGSLFLDEVGDMSLAAQAKILRAVETRIIQRLGSNVDTRVQVRLVAATNQSLERLVEEKRFREDLFYRLNVVRLTLPSLRERLEDIPELVEHILGDLGRQHGQPTRTMQGELIRDLQQYAWPGNVRELRNVIESILVFSNSRSLGSADVPAEIRQKLTSSKVSYGNERCKILEALESTRWNRNAAAKILSCSRMTLYRKMTKHGITVE